MTHSPRKPHFHGGLQVRICGKKINSDANIVCQQAPGPHPIHTAIAVSVSDGKIYAFIMDATGEVEAWQLVGDEE